MLAQDGWLAWRAGLWVHAHFCLCPCTYGRRQCSLHSASALHTLDAMFSEVSYIHRFQRGHM